MHEIIRAAEKVTADKNGIRSDCNQISFINRGDTPVDITIKDTKLTFTLAGRTDAKTDYLVFGSLNPELWETTLFNLAFGTTVNTEIVDIMRVTLVGDELGTDAA